MFTVAQTNLQLFRQLTELGYSLPERERAAAAYRFLMPMFAGLYRGNEKPFIAHLVGTASILAAQRESIEVVLAGMLHAVYMAGDFGFEPGTRQTRRKRRCIENLAGKDVEELVAIYDDMRWNAAGVGHYLHNLETLSSLERTALRVRLANTLEDLLDHGMNYTRGSKAKDISTVEMQGTILTLARALNCGELADQLRTAMSQFNSAVSPLSVEGFMGRSALVLPPSVRRKFLPRARGWIVRRLRVIVR